ncbi:MAG: DUF2807 domain-containing protein [Cyclobacteriaceae bacterium]|nr:DUF2807 domain-containing protein [Cyclobacteriaceae bacterium]
MQSCAINRFFIFSILIYSNLLISCDFSINQKKGNGKISLEEYYVDGFNSLRIGGNYRVNLIPGDRNLVTIETDENLLPYINVESHSGTLSINNIYDLKSKKGITIEVFYKDLNKIYSMGASKILHNDILKTDKLTVDLAGTGLIELNVDADESDVILSGAGLIRMKGQVNRQTVTLSGAGAYKASAFKSELCRISLLGLGSAEVYVREELEATVNGLGSITYGGRPKVVSRNISGLGKIEPDSRLEDGVNL